MNDQGKVLSHWWMLIPMLPSRNSSWQYKVLKRIWFDHTMQQAKQDLNGSITVGGRGFHNIKSEDHLTVVLFHNWSLFPNNDWCSSFLKSCGANPVGEVEKIRWSFGYEEYLQGSSKRPIADVVVKWRDKSGEAILVIEAKCKGLKKDCIAEKDIPTKSLYLNLPKIKKYSRKSACLLVDTDDVEYVKKNIGETESIITWQKLASLQIEAANSLEISESVKEFVVGSILNKFCSYGIVPEQLPYLYLESELSAVEITKNKTQKTNDRQIAYWEF